MDDPGWSRAWPKDGYCSNSVAQRSILRQRHLENGTVDSRCINYTSQEHSKRVLVRTRFDNAAKVIPIQSFLRQVISREVVSGMRSRLVVGPGSTAQIIKIVDSAVRAHDHVAVIDRLAAVARM